MGTSLKVRIKTDTRGLSAELRGSGLAPDGTRSFGVERGWFHDLDALDAAVEESLTDAENEDGLQLSPLRDEWHRVLADARRTHRAPQVSTPAQAPARTRPRS